MTMKQHMILGNDRRDVEARCDEWLSENPAIRVVRVHRPRREPDSWLTRLGGRDVPRVSITVEYELQTPTNDENSIAAVILVETASSHQR
jgi:hypothetical protein